MFFSVAFARAQDRIDLIFLDKTQLYTVNMMHLEYPYCGIFMVCVCPTICHAMALLAWRLFWGADHCICLPLPGSSIFSALVGLCHGGVSGRGAPFLRPADSPLDPFFMQDDYTEMSIGLKCHSLSRIAMTAWQRCRRYSRRKQMSA